MTDAVRKPNPGAVTTSGETEWIVAAEKARAEAWLDGACFAREELPSLLALLADVRRDSIEMAASVVDKQASIHRMRAQAFADDSDRADGSAQADDIDTAETFAELLGYVAGRIRALPFTSKGEGKEHGR